ncbi:MAG: helix-turn-helix transcriptional regulator [Caulobacteraceae bacterium]|nr:helix-turn-helix transcriptional regulator [Caulobacteraceae bacterium]
MTSVRRGLTGLHTAENKRLMARLVDARHAASLSQYQLADRLGVDQSYVSKYESCRRRLDVIEFLKVVAALGADPAELLADLDVPKLQP